MESPSEAPTFQHLTPFVWRALVLLPCAVLGILFVTFGEKHLENQSCDSLDDGVGIAQWMYYMGFCLLSLVTLLCFCPPWQLVQPNDDDPGAATLDPPPTPARSANGHIHCIKGTWALLVLCTTGWFLYGAVVVFYDHPNESGCPEEVHSFAYHLILSMLVISGFVGLVICGRKIAGSLSNRSDIEHSPLTDVTLEHSKL